MNTNIWYERGYTAGCHYLAKCSEMDLLDHMDQNEWEGDEPDCLQFEAGFGAAYGCDEDED